MDIWLGGDSLDNVMEFVNLVNSDFFMCSRRSHVQDKTSKQLAVLWLTRNPLKEASYAKDNLKLVAGYQVFPIQL